MKSSLRVSRLVGPAAIVAAGAAFLVAPPADAGRVHRVEIGSNYFAPGKQAVKAGDKVRFTWAEGGFDVHDVNVRRGPQRFRSPLQSSGTWTTRKLRKPGRYVLYCSQHLGMEMRLTVRKR